MGKIFSVLLGIAAIVSGALLLSRWWFHFVRAMQAVLPGILIAGGLVALLAGISELKDSAKK